MTVTVAALVTINENNPWALGKYFEITGPLLEAVGARIKQRFTVQESVVGQRPSQSIILVDYPSKEAVDAVFKSKAYETAKEYRDKAFTTYSINIISNEDGQTDLVDEGG